MLRYGGHRVSSSQIRADRKREMETSLPTWARNCPLILGSLSNDDADGIENGQKAIGLISKTTTMHVHHAFFVHFFGVIARLQRESA